MRAKRPWLTALLLACTVPWLSIKASTISSTPNIPDSVAILLNQALGAGDTALSAKILGQYYRFRSQSIPKTFTVRSLLPGKPSIRNFDYQDYQSWARSLSIIQDEEGIILVGNTYGLLEFDGNNWRKLDGTISHNFMCLERSANGPIYSICLKGKRTELGMIIRNKNGFYTYKAIHTSRLNLNPKEDARLAVTANGLVFSSYKSLYHWNQSGLTVLDSNARFQVFSTKQGIYFSKEGAGLYKWHPNGKHHFLKGSGPLGQLDIVKLFSHHSSGMLVLTRQGIFNLKDGYLSQTQTDIDGYLAQYGLQCATKLHDGRLALGTAGGLLIINSQGQLLQLVTAKLGLQHSNVKAILQDESHNLWLTLSSGISFLQYPTASTRYDTDFGIGNLVNCIIEHQGSLYLGAIDSFAYSAQIAQSPALKFNAGSHEWMKGLFSRLPGIKFEGWKDLIARNDTLFISTFEDVFFHTDGQSTRLGIKTLQGIFPSSTNPVQILGIPTNTGWLSRLDVHSGPSWKITPLRHVGQRGWYRLITTPNSYWMGTHTKGLLRVPKRQQPPAKPMHYGQNKGLSAGKYYACSFKDQVLAVSRDDTSIWAYNSTLDSFINYKPLEKALFQENRERKQYYFLEHDEQYLVLDEQGDTLLPPLGGLYWPKQVLDVYAICTYFSSDAEWWRGGLHGLERYVQPEPQGMMPPITSIRSVQLGLKNPATHHSLAPDQVPFSDNRLTIHYSAPLRDAKQLSQYSYRIASIHEDWTDWSSASTARYDNLPAGKHIFEVKAKDFLGYKGPSARYAFHVLKPWYQTTWSYIGYGIASILIAILSMHIYTQRLRRQKRRLTRLVKERTIKIERQTQQLEEQRDLLQDRNLELQSKNERINSLMVDIMHRSKGSLQLSKSLLEMQARRIHDEGARGALTEARNRLDLLEDIQRQLLKGKAGAKSIGTQSFVPKLCYDLKEAYQLGNPVELSLDIDPINLEAEQATFIGLILSELQTNSYKYAFKANPSPKLLVAIKHQGESLTIKIKDNGPGISDNPKPNKPESYGSLLIQSFTKQLKGTLKAYYQNGAVTEISVPWKAIDSSEE